jgi:geranylgeranyl diphosphate synthase type II
MSAFVFENQKMRSTIGPDIKEDAVESWETTWEEFRGQVNSGLEFYVLQGMNCPPQLQKAMSYSLLAGGKRLRPVLVMLACEACGGQAQQALPAACALEMVHTYSLIHDDLPAMDDDDLRRGRPTNHKVFGEAMAILAGDALLTLAFEVVATRTAPAEVAAACCADLANAAGAVGMVAGQVADLEAEASGVASLEILEGIHRRKTGRLLCSALTLGARVAQANEETLTSLKEYGLLIGLAFQITDDLLDIRGNVEKVGKGVNKDAALGKLTYPSLLGVEASERRAQSLIADACRLIEPLGERGRMLRELALFILNRDH